MRHLTCEKMDVPKMAPGGALNTRCNMNRGQPCLRANDRLFYVLGVNGLEHMEKRCAESWKRLRNDHVQLHVRAYEDCPVSWRRHTCGCYTARGASEHRLHSVWSIASVGGEIGPSDACSDKDADKRERETPTPCENEQAQNSKKRGRDKNSRINTGTT